MTGGISAQVDGDSVVNGVTYRDGTLGTVANATAYSVDPAAANGGTITLSAAENIILNGDGLVLGFATANLTLARDTTTVAASNVTSVS